MSNWRIKEIFSPKYNKTLYIPQHKGLFFYKNAAGKLTHL